MRRKDREISDLEEIISIMKKCDVCRLAFFDKDYPYIIPLNFGFSSDGTNIELYFHGAPTGKKLNLIKDNNKAGFEMDCSHKLITAKEACEYTMEYESICGNGTVELLKDNEKKEALTYLMKQYSDADSFLFNEKMVSSIAVYKLKVSEITGKRLMGS